MYAVLAGLLLVLVTGAISFERHTTAQRLEAEIVAMRAQAELLSATVQRNLFELNQCLQVNAQNKIARDSAVEQVAVAEKRVRDLAARLRNTRQLIAVDLEELRNAQTDTECRTLADPLPSNFVDWLWDDP